MKVIIEFDDEKNNFSVPFTSIAKLLNITEAQVIEAVRQAVKTQ